MPVQATPLTAAKVKTATPGRYADGDGLYLLVRQNKTGFWLFRYTRDGRMREMGLGRARGRNAVALADAREKAAVLHRLVRGGIDPLDQRAAEAKAAKASAQAAAARGITFAAVARFYLDAHESAWRNAKHRWQWSATLESFVFSHMGNLPVADVGTAHVLAALEPIWTSKPETATRVRGRIEAILDYAKVREWRSGENPARWRGHLSNVLPARSKVAPVEHHAALPWKKMGAFMADLRQQNGVAARALEFTILTAARTGEVIGAQWGEFDMQAAVWTVPAARMKAKREHRVPLSAPALGVLREIAGLRTNAGPDAIVFPGQRQGLGLSNMSMLALLRRMGRGDFTVHGTARSGFRTWCAETGKPNDIAEAALAHMLEELEGSYQHGDLLERRRELMAAWGVYCEKPEADVVPLLRKVG